MTQEVNETTPIIPIIDCPICGAKDVPLSHVSTMRKEGHPDIEIWQCTQCGKVPNIGHDIEVKRYVSISELREMGWSEEGK